MAQQQCLRGLVLQVLGQDEGVNRRQHFVTCRMPINAINAVIGGKRMKRHSKIRQGRRTRNVGGDQVDQEPRGLIAYVDIELAIEESLPFSVGSLVEKMRAEAGPATSSR